MPLFALDYAFAITITRTSTSANRKEIYPLAFSATACMRIAPAALTFSEFTWP